MNSVEFYSSVPRNFTTQNNQRTTGNRFLSVANNDTVLTPVPKGEQLKSFVPQSTKLIKNNGNGIASNTSANFSVSKIFAAGVGAVCLLHGVTTTAAPIIGSSTGTTPTGTTNDYKHDSSISAETIVNIAANAFLFLVLAASAGQAFYNRCIKKEVKIKHV